MSVFQPQPVIEHTCLLAEGPVWDSKRNTICWIDILNGALHEYNVINSSHLTLAMDQMIGSFAVCDNGNFITALQNGFAFVERISGKRTMIIDPEKQLPNNRFNDGKCDPLGRFWAGTMSLSEDEGAGNLYTLERNLSFQKKITGVTISNGMAWSADSRTFYYIDTPTRQVVAYDFDLTSGEIRNRRVVIELNNEDGYPDGMTIDNEDMIWIAHWNGWQVSRWNPHTGKKLLSIAMPVAKVTSCTFGGDQLTDLYITTAKVNLTEDELKAQPLAGSLFVVKDCGFKGVPAFEFKT